jgi:AraC-like DNA-binding protein
MENDFIRYSSDEYNRIIPVEGTALSYIVYSVKESPARMHERGTLEIIFCLKGSVKFSYSYEEFTIREGEYVSVDVDAYYLHEGRDNICVSLFMDLEQYEDRYPDISRALFICEGIAGHIEPYQITAHNKLKGTMIAVLKNIADGETDSRTRARADSITDIFISSFEIAFFDRGACDISDIDLRRLRKVNRYIKDHMKEKVRISDIAELLSFTESYTSEYLRKMSQGYKTILEYIRVNASERYLLETDMTIAAISEECGFSNTKYYYKAFRKWYKCTPKEFRGEYRRHRTKDITYLPIEAAGGLINNMLVEHYMNIFD